MEAIRDGNHIPVALGVDTTNSSNTLPFKVDPATGRLQVATGGADGDVVGPSSSTDNAIVRFDGTTGKLIQNSALIVDDTTGNITGPAAGFKITGGTGTTADLSFQTTSGVGATGADMHFLVGNNGATEALTILNSGWVGVMNTAPNSSFEVVSQDNSFPIWMTAYNSAGAAVPGLIGRSARGTVASPSVVTTNDVLNSLAGRGYHSGGAFSSNSTGFVAMRAAETFTSTAQGTYIDFSTTPSGSTSRAVAMTILGNGNAGIGQTTPTAVLHIKAGTATAGTAPIKLTTGTITTTAVAGQYEYNDNHRVTNVALLRYPLGGTLFDFFTDTTVGGAEADIYTSTLLANTFNANGDKVVASYSGNFVTGGTELTQLKAVFAGTTIWDSTGLAPATGTTSWRVFVELIRVSSTVVRFSVSLNTTGATGYVYETTGELTGLTLSSTNILKITGASSGVGSGSGDIVGKMGYVDFKPAS